MPPMFTMRSGPPDLSRIRPDLMVGGYPVPGDVAWLAREHGVTAVLSLQDDADLAAKRLDLSELEHAYRDAGLAFTRIPVTDGDEARMIHVLPDTVAQVASLHAAAHVVYVHCNAGLNRAPTVAIAYLHVHEGRALDDATRFVKAKRPCVPFQCALVHVYGRRSLPPRDP